MRLLPWECALHDEFRAEGTAARVYIDRTGCPRRETACSVCKFATDCTGPSGSRPVSCLRRALLPVTSSSFTALKHHSRSWRRHAREFEVKPLSFRLKPQPTTTAEATLVGKISLPSLPTQPMSGPTPPISAYLRRLRRAARGGQRQLGQAQECSSQTVSGSLSQPFAHRGRSYHLPWAYL